MGAVVAGLGMVQDGIRWLAGYGEADALRSQPQAIAYTSLVPVTTTRAVSPVLLVLALLFAGHA